MNSKNNFGWGQVNEGKYDADEHARKVDASEEELFSQRANDIPGSLRNRLVELVATDNEEVVQVLAEAGIENLRAKKRFFLSDGTPATIYADAEGWHAIVNTRHQELKFTAADRDSAMLAAERHMAAARGPRALSESELLRVARLAQSGQSAAAIELFVGLSLGGNDQRSAEEILTDPKLSGLLNTAAIVVWRYTRQDYTPDEEFEALLDRAASIKPLTLHIVDALYDKYLDTKSEAARSTRRVAHNPAPETEQIPSQADLENLSDRDVEKLTTASLRERAHEIRRFNDRIYGR